MNEPVMVFWSYDLPPYILAGEGVIDALGNAKISSYQMTIKRENILAVRPLEQGRQLKAVLEQVEETYFSKHKQLKLDMRDVIKSKIPEVSEYLNSVIK